MPREKTIGDVNNTKQKHFCCSAFGAAVCTSNPNHDVGAFIRSNHGWCINGCCGGGCFVVTDMLYCPFCGEKLQ